MKREHRYIVIKEKDLQLAGVSQKEMKILEGILEKVRNARSHRGAIPLECVVVESDWPEYDETWWAIAARMDNIPRHQAEFDQIARYGVSRPPILKDDGS